MCFILLLADLSILHHKLKVRFKKYECVTKVLKEGSQLAQKYPRLFYSFVCERRRQMKLYLFVLGNNYGTHLNLPQVGFIKTRQEIVGRQIIHQTVTIAFRIQCLSVKSNVSWTILLTGDKNHSIILGLKGLCLPSTYTHLPLVRI